MVARFFIVVVVLFFSCLPAHAQSKDVKEILAILDNQTMSWNKGNLEEFMGGYWNNDSLSFVGKSGVTYGYQNTLNNYRKNYDGPAKMGKLSFDILQVKKLSADYYFVLGKWSLKRDAGDVGGHYTLLFRKIAGRWKIISDHSS